MSRLKTELYMTTKVKGGLWFDTPIGCENLSEAFSVRPDNQRLGWRCLPA